VLDIWRKFKFYGYRRISAYTFNSKQAPSLPNISKYIALKLRRKIGIKSRMHKRFNKPKTTVDVAQQPNLIRHFADLGGLW